MKYSKLIRLLVSMILSIIMLSITLVSAGCTASISGTTATELQATMVPPVDLDVYIYVNQQVPTNIPKSLTGAPADISVQSLAIWGVVNNETQYTVAGALTFTNPADASAIFAQLPNSPNIYTKLSESTIYFLRGSGGPADIIKNAIANNNFEHYDDTAALTEVSKLPSGGTTRPGLIGIVKPNQAALNLVKQYLDQNTANTINSVFSYGKPSVIALGVFGSQPINLADIAQRISNNTLWDMDLGVVVSMNSAYPGLIFSPIASRVISNQGFPEVKVGNLTAYKDTVNVGNGQTVPIYLNVGDNHVFATASGNDSYAQTLLTNINR